MELTRDSVEYAAHDPGVVPTQAAPAGAGVSR
jgi:hypothetical protein